MYMGHDEQMVHVTVGEYFGISFAIKRRSKRADVSTSGLWLMLWVSIQASVSSCCSTLPVRGGMVHKIHGSVHNLALNSQCGMFNFG